MSLTTTPAARRTVYIVDDHPIIRQGLTLLINREHDLSVCGGAEEAGSALRGIEELKPDLILLDISLNGPDGLDLLKIIRTRDAALPVLMLSMLEESLYAERSLRAGANGYIMKQEDTERVLLAIRRILAGEIYVSDNMASRMLHRMVGGTPIEQEPSVADLSDRELEVFRLIGEGHSTRQIALDLHISVKTVESYQAHIKEKLSLKNARELMQSAIQWTVAGKRA